MYYNLIMDDKMITSILQGNRPAIQDLYGNISFKFSKGDFSLNILYYEFYDQMSAWQKDYNDEQFEYISYRQGLEEFIFTISPIANEYKLNFRNNSSVLILSKEEMFNLINETKQIIIKILKIWYSEEEISNIVNELF